MQFGDTGFNSFLKLIPNPKKISNFNHLLMLQFSAQKLEITWEDFRDEIVKNTTVRALWSRIKRILEISLLDYLGCGEARLELQKYDHGSQLLALLQETHTFLSANVERFNEELQTNLEILNNKAGSLIKNIVKTTQLVFKISNKQQVTAYFGKGEIIPVSNLIVNNNPGSSLLRVYIRMVSLLKHLTDGVAITTLLPEKKKTKDSIGPLSNANTIHIAALESTSKPQEKRTSQRKRKPTKKNDTFAFQPRSRQKRSPRKMKISSSINTSSTATTQLPMTPASAVKSAQIADTTPRYRKCAKLTPESEVSSTSVKSTLRGGRSGYQNNRIQQYNNYDNSSQCSRDSNAQPNRHEKNTNDRALEQTQQQQLQYDQNFEQSTSPTLENTGSKDNMEVEYTYPQYADEPDSESDFGDSSSCQLNQLNGNPKFGFMQSLQLTMHSPLQQLGVQLEPAPQAQCNPLESLSPDHEMIDPLAHLWDQDLNFVI